MEKIIFIIIILVIFGGSIFGFLGWLLGFLGGILDFILEIKDKIDDITRKIKRNKRHRKLEKAKQQHLKEIDSEYSKQNYKRVIALFREVMNDKEMYSVSAKMKYCHVAADSVCFIAENVSEWEEARTWARILRKRDKSFEAEADKIYQEITDRSGDFLFTQDELIHTAFEMLKDEETETAEFLFEEASQNGSFDAICIRTDLAISAVQNEEGMKAAESWIEKVKAIDTYSAREFETKLKEIPYVKYKEHRDNVQKYVEEAKKTSGGNCIKIMEKAANEMEGMYKYSNALELASSIMETYIMLAEDQKKYYPKGDESFAIHAGYYKRAYEWANIAAEGGDEKAKKIIEALKAKVELNDMVMEMSKKREGV